MDRTVTAQLAASRERLFAVVSDLGTFPDWLELVNRVEPAPAHASDPGPAFSVTLRAAVGPFARSKRLRMCRNELDASAGHVQYQRCETDGRQHAAWIMTADVSTATDDTATDDTATADGSRPDAVERSLVVIRLRYDGRMWSSLLDGVLDHAVERATRRLEDRANA